MLPVGVSTWVFDQAPAFRSSLGLHPVFLLNDGPPDATEPG